MLAENSWAQKIFPYFKILILYHLNSLKNIETEEIFNFLKELDMIRLKPLNKNLYLNYQTEVMK
jgi:hypothetical protein